MKILNAIISITLLFTFHSFSQNLIELPQYRTRYSKTFVDPITGNMFYKTHTMRIHYWENASWLDIDNSITAFNAEYYVRDGSDMLVYFSKTQNQVKFQIGQQWMKLTFTGFTALNGNQQVGQYTPQLPNVLNDSLFHYSNSIPFHDFIFCVLNDRVNFKIVIMNDILNSFAAATDFEYHFEIEHSDTFKVENGTVSLGSTNLDFFVIYQWLVRNLQGIAPVNQIAFTRLPNNRMSLKCRINTSRILNTSSTDSTIIETVIYQSAVRNENGLSFDYYVAQKNHSGSIIRYEWFGFPDYWFSIYPWVGRYDNYAQGDNETYRAYHYWELWNIPAGSTIQKVEYLKVEVVNREEGPNPSSCLSINTANLIFDDPNTSDYQSFYDAIDDGITLNNKQYCNIGDKWNPGAITSGDVLQSIQSAINAGREYFAIGLYYQGNPQDLLLMMEAGFSNQNYALVITYQGPTTIPISDAALPRNYQLRNYPNPFNIATTLRFQLPVSEQVEIRIYNIKGQIIRELINDNFLAGNYKRNWDGKDEMGNVVASGVYWISMVTPTYRKTIPCLLVK